MLRVGLLLLAVLLLTSALLGRDDAKKPGLRRVAVQDHDVDVDWGKNDLHVDGHWQVPRYGKSSTAVVIECEKKSDECLLIEGWLEDGEAKLMVDHYSVVHWTDDEVLAEPAGMFGPMCYRAVLAVRLAKPFKGEFPERATGDVTLTITPKAANKKTQEACGQLQSTVYRLKNVCTSCAQQ